MNIDRPTLRLVILFMLVMGLGHFYSSWKFGTLERRIAALEPAQAVAQTSQEYPSDIWVYPFAYSLDFGGYVEGSYGPYVGGFADEIVAYADSFGYEYDAYDYGTDYSYDAYEYEVDYSYE